MLREYIPIWEDSFLFQVNVGYGLDTGMTAKLLNLSDSLQAGAMQWSRADGY